MVEAQGGKVSPRLEQSRHFERPAQRAVVVPQSETALGSQAETMVSQEATRARGEVGLTLRLDHQRKGKRNKDGQGKDARKDSTHRCEAYNAER